MRVQRGLPGPVSGCFSLAARPSRLNSGSVPILSRRRSRRPQSAIIVVLLLLTLGLAAVLAQQAHQAARVHRAAAESTLRDYAAFAAWKFAGHVRSEFYGFFMTA